MYEPPVMPPFPETADDLKATLAGYMREQRPMDMFFEFFIAEVIGGLPAATASVLDAYAREHSDAFPQRDWRAGVRSALQLSDTIDIAILDVWYRNRESVRQLGFDYHPWHFAINFENEYFADGSMIDVWPDGALESAKARIAQERGSSA